MRTDEHPDKVHSPNESEAISFREQWFDLRACMLRWAAQAPRRQARTLAMAYRPESVTKGWHAAHCLLVRLTREELGLLRNEDGLDELPYADAILAALQNPETTSFDRMAFLDRLEDFRLLPNDQEKTVFATLEDPVVVDYFWEHREKFKNRPWYTRACAKAKPQAPVSGELEAR